MPTATSKGSSGPKPIPATGNHKARCIHVIDLGTQLTPFKNDDGSPKSIRQVRLVFELVETSHTFREEKGPQPFVVDLKETLSLSEKANLRKHIRSWRGKDLTPQEEESWDIANVIGKPCLVNVVHNHGKGKNSDKIYANIASITPPMGTTPAAQNECLVFDFGKPNTMEVYNKLPEFVQKMIETTPEWRAETKGGGDTGGIRKASAEDKDEF